MDYEMEDDSNDNDVLIMSMTMTMTITVITVMSSSFCISRPTCTLTGALSNYTPYS